MSKVNIEDLRDLSDFCEHWPKLKQILHKKNLELAVDDSDIKQLVGWLVLLADKTCILEIE